eukprot:TRINITY_DN1317_c0_g4_i1.p1 TRINITY_DN1317_c0_g4~~TRINITY_DN1317_c0_g4_i1.p1  ORF type:complete len:485 (+),score=249.24 TRINITY_DN1317_c0_g4_i1:352-1806(+)
MVGYKTCQKLLEALDSGLPVESESIPPDPARLPAAKPPAKPAQPAAQQPKRKSELPVEQLQVKSRPVEQQPQVSDAPRPAAPSASGSDERSQILLHLLNSLDKQKNVAGARLIKAAFANPHLPIPKHHWETREVDSEVRNDDVPLDQLELTIVACRGLTADASSPYVYVAFGYIKDDLPAQKTQTPVGTPPNAVFNHTHRFNIQRKKSFMAYCERKRQTLELFNKRLLFSSTSLGKAEVSLAPLLTRSTHSEIAQIKNGRKLVGEVEVRLRLRQPLNGVHRERSIEQLAVLDDVAAALSPPPQPQQQQQQQQQQAAAVRRPAAAVTAAAAPAVTSPSTAQRPAAPRPSVATARAAATRPAAVAQGAVDDEPDDDSVDDIVSNDVLEHELELVTKRLDELSARKVEPPPELVDRQQALQIKINLLAMQVESGAVDMDSYLGLLQQHVVLAKKRAVDYKQAGNIELAKKFLSRAKIIEAEIKQSLE